MTEQITCDCGCTSFEIFHDSVKCSKCEAVYKMNMIIPTPGNFNSTRDRRMIKQGKLRVSDVKHI